MLTNLLSNPNGFLLFIALILGALFLRSLAIQAMKNRDASPFFLLIAGIALVLFLTLTKGDDQKKVAVVDSHHIER
jgi:hypothetical protein